MHGYIPMRTFSSKPTDDNPDNNDAPPKKRRGRPAKDATTPQEVTQPKRTR